VIFIRCQVCRANTDGPDVICYDCRAQMIPDSVTFVSPEKIEVEKGYSIVVDFFEFCGRPNSLWLSGPFWSKVWHFFKILVFQSIILIFLLVALFVVLPTPEGPPSVLDDLLKNLSFGTFLLIAILGPLVEETAFRLTLRWSVWNISLGLGAFAIFILTGMLGDFSPQTGWLQGLIIIGSLLMVVFVIRQFLQIPRIYESIRAFYNQYYGAIFYGIAILFAAMHILNHETGKITLDWLVPFMLFRTVHSTIMGYIRVRFGFGWGFVYHAINNSGMVLLISLASKAV
jgi:hypothetical protein